MKAAGKIFKILLLLTASVLLILISLSFILRDQVGEIILDSLNRNISTRISIGTFRLSLLKKFPKASLEIKDVLVFSSSGFNKDSFRYINSDTLLVAENLSVDFKLTDILKGVYDIERIGISNGEICLLTDSAGRVNYRLSYGTDVTEKEEMSLDLQRIILSEMKVTYHNLATKLMLDGVIGEGRISSRITGNDIMFNADADLLLTAIRIDSFRINKPFSARLELKMEDSQRGILFRKGSLALEGFRFNISGSVSDDKNLNLDLSAEEIDLSKIRKYLPPGYLKHIADYDLSGSLSLKGHLTGAISNTAYPHLEATCVLNKGSIVYPATGMIIRNLSFTGFYSNGPGNRAETSSISVKNFRALIGSAAYEGHFTVRNLKNPVSELDFTGRIIPGELKQYFTLKSLSAASGYCDLKLKLRTDYWPKDSITLDDIVKLKPEAALNFKSLSLGITGKSILVSDVNGEVFLSDILTARNLILSYKGQYIVINGDFINLPGWITGQNVPLKADADIYFNILSPETFAAENPTQKERVAGKQAFRMPPDLELDIRLKADSLKYERFPASKMVVHLVYRQGTFTFNTLHMKSLDGIISGNGFISQNSNKSLLARGVFALDGINIRNTFLRFRNFGQDFIKADNLSGNLTGTLSLLLPLDSLLKPQVRSLIAEGRYVITDGSLIDFGPVKELSSFIKLSELENIRFARLENDFFIRNNSLYIPQMEVNSSAADLSVNGKHNFDNTFEYHAKIRLSEILSKKRKRSKTSVTEFGVVEDDGLGRTSLLLRIESQGDKIKVGYDVKAAGNKVKNSISNERQSLKTILNQEYGLYKNDSVPVQKTEEKKPRFRISWDESDTLKTEPEPDAARVKKENPLKKLLKKK